MSVIIGREGGRWHLPLREWWRYSESVRSVCWEHVLLSSGSYHPAAEDTQSGAYYNTTSREVHCCHCSLVLVVVHGSLSCPTIVMHEYILTHTSKSMLRASSSSLASLIVRPFTVTPPRSSYTRVRRNGEVRNGEVREEGKKVVMCIQIDFTTVCLPQWWWVCEGVRMVLWWRVNRGGWRGGHTSSRCRSQGMRYWWGSGGVHERRGETRE